MNILNGDFFWNFIPQDLNQIMFSKMYILFVDLLTMTQISGLAVHPYIGFFVTKRHQRSYIWYSKTPE